MQESPLPCIVPLTARSWKSRILHVRAQVARWYLPLSLIQPGKLERSILGRLLESRDRSPAKTLDIRAWRAGRRAALRTRRIRELRPITNHSHGYPALPSLGSRNRCSEATRSVSAKTAIETKTLLLRASCRWVCQCELAEPLLERAKGIGQMESNKHRTPAGSLAVYGAFWHLRYLLVDSRCNCCYFNTSMSVKS
ncbi:hypothetical protein V8C44DRAFT_283173 [Trichoderma aethiopicum]